MGDCVPGDHIAGGHKAPLHSTGASLPFDRRIPTIRRAHSLPSDGRTPLRMNIDLRSLAGRRGNEVLRPAKTGQNRFRAMRTPFQ